MEPLGNAFRLHGFRAACVRSQSRMNPKPYLVAEWMHFTLFGIILPTIKLKV